MVVDSSDYQASYTFGWDESSSHTIEVATTQSGISGTQYVLVSWSDGGLPSHDITVSPSTMTYTANFTTQYQLATAVDPLSGGTVSPDHPAGWWYDSGSSVLLTAAANTAYVSTSWSGDCGRADLTTTVLMDAPKTCTANFCAPADIGGVSKSSLQTAFNDVQAGNTIRVVEGILAENADFAAGVSAVLRGGYNCAFNEHLRPLHTRPFRACSPVTHGTLTVDNLIIR